MNNLTKVKFLYHLKKIDYNDLNSTIVKFCLKKT